VPDQKDVSDDAPPLAAGLYNISFQIKGLMMTVFAAPVFDASVIFEGNELFKGQGAASVWAERLAKELGSAVTVKKLGTGWALYGSVDGEDRVWAIYGQRLKRID